MQASWRTGSQVDIMQHTLGQPSTAVSIMALARDWVTGSNTQMSRSRRSKVAASCLVPYTATRMLCWLLL